MHKSTWNHSHLGVGGLCGVVQGQEDAVDNNSQADASIKPRVRNQPIRNLVNPKAAHVSECIQVYDPP